MDFYSDHYGDSNTDPQCTQEILQMLPKLGSAGLEGELTVALQQLSQGYVTGVNGLTLT